MRHRIVWLWIWITMTLWLGNITGCSTPSQVEQDPEARTQALVEAWARQWKPPADSAGVEPAISSPDSSTPVRCGPMAAGDVCDTCQGEIACKLHETPVLTPTMSRWHWPRIKVDAHIGQTRHHPIYFQDCPIHAAESHPDRTASHEAAINAVMRRDRADGHSAVNLRAMAAQPLKAAFDLLALPVQMVIDPPWNTNTTP